MSEEHLVSTPNEQSPRTLGPPRGTSNKKALLVSGLTVLGIVLVAGQAFTAYTVYKHSEKLTMLQTRSERLQEISHRVMVNRTPMRMAKPMNSFPLLISDTADEKKEKSTPPPEKVPMTKCQQEAAGLVQTSLASFRPQCDEQGAYMPEQCWQEAAVCWCVDKNGTQQPDSVAQGHAQCSTDVAMDK
ncbi:CD74 molecule, major histocompatibility complex, class II invariant chain b [Trichomycterus rosablanca]|uniref:CD74 molecule, major histocompatibility complex, class II invariant chain b n=1 Tax=Trichomycterus rosablanca TaxID=2290929 RepID=UPI002F3609AC